MISVKPQIYGCRPGHSDSYPYAMLRSPVVVFGLGEVYSAREEVITALYPVFGWVRSDLGGELG